MKARKFTLKAFDTNENNDYKHLLIAILQTPKDLQRGTSPSEMAAAVPIIMKLKDVDTPTMMKEVEILFEEAEHKEIVSRFSTYPFQSNSEKTLDFINEFKEAEKVAMEEKKPDEKKPEGDSDESGADSEAETPAE